MTSACIRRAGPIVVAAAAGFTIAGDGSQAPRTYQNLLKLFDDFVAFERPALKDGAPEDAVQTARAATTEFVTWLERQAPSKTGPSGFGKETSSLTRSGTSSILAQQRCRSPAGAVRGAVFGTVSAGEC